MQLAPPEVRYDAELLIVDLTDERFDRVIISATANEHEGFSSDDIVWLLERAPAEVMILRPGPDDHRMVIPLEPGAVSTNGNGVAA